MAVIAGPSPFRFEATRPGEFRDNLVLAATHHEDVVGRCEDLPGAPLLAASSKMLSFRPNTPGAESSLVVQAFTTGTLVGGDHIRLDLNASLGLRSKGDVSVVFHTPGEVTATLKVERDGNFISSFELELDATTLIVGGSEVKFEIASLLNPQSIRPPTVAAMSAYGSSQSLAVQKQTDIQCPAFVAGGITRRDSTVSVDGIEQAVLMSEGAMHLGRRLFTYAKKDTVSILRQRRLSEADVTPSAAVSVNILFTSPWEITSGDIIEGRFPTNGYTFVSDLTELETNLPDASVEWIDSSRLLRITVLGNIDADSAIELNFTSIETPPYVVASPSAEIALLQTDVYTVGETGISHSHFATPTQPIART
jgi:hypothetical protein